MKTILIIIAVFLCMTLSSVLGESTSGFNNENSDDFLRQSLPDSVYSLVRGNPVIFYSYGHYGYSWSIIAKMDSGYQAFSGRVGYGGDYHFNEPAENNQIDTTLLFSKNQNLFSWGLDTISSSINIMRKISSEHHVTYYTYLYVVNSAGLNIFSSDNAVAYSGPDSLSFNKKFHKLCLIMRWLSDSNIRKYIPDSVIY